MPTEYVVALVVLILLAVFDLWVGVTNDAANFMNGAIGGRAASLRRIVIVAAVGVLLGALLSGGMMEVARKGVFNPSFFHDQRGLIDVRAILTIYLGVMAADVILLDLFNTFGLPTSTTVSLVSELLGASFAVALWTSGDFGSALGALNGGPIGGIYGSILLSVIVAFSVSALIMFLLRLLFTHDLGRTFRRFGWLWAGVSVSALLYLVIYKGLKGATLLSPELVNSLRDHIWWVLAGAFVTVSSLTYLFARRHERILQLLILGATGALAMAFAANDLVNFLGPSVAAGQATLVDGVNLSGKVPAPTWVLLIAGVVMCGALWLSRKSRSVTDTELRIASQGNREQRFRSSWLARILFRVFRPLCRLVAALFPPRVRAFIDRRTTVPPHVDGAAPYDFLRASVSLTVASVVISFGTANKLPLSTTYITFMAAMGASVADRRWTSASAEARLTGVLTVMGGWLVTGLIAALGAFVTASILFHLGLSVGLPVILAFVIIAVWKLALAHRRRSAARPTVVDEELAVGAGRPVPGRAGAVGLGSVAGEIRGG